MRKLAIVLCLVACSGDKSKNATPKGTKVVEWDASKSTRAAFKTATFENRAPHDDVITVKVCADEVKLRLHADAATAKYTEGDRPVEVRSIDALTIAVEDAKGFEITKGACDGPNYMLTAPESGTGPGYTILDCHFKATKPNNDCSALFQLKGDGTLLN